jgi:hypothetical protein
VRKLAVAALILLVGACWPGAPRAEASGIITHSWMALDAIPRLEDAHLRAILNRHRADVEAGAHFPDSGYAPGRTYGEAAHWPRFHEEVARRIATTCDLEAPSPTCERSIAHLFGAVAHGIGDQVWDWLFEPNGPDRGESYVPPPLRNAFSPDGLEMQMDLVAIRDYDRRTTPAIPEWPVPARLRAAFAATGEGGAGGDELHQGYVAISVARNAERQLAATYHDDVVRHMRWTSSHLVTGPGGIRFAARAIAAAWDDLWARMRGESPTTSVSVTYPADGETGVPTTGWDRPSFEPGSAPNAADGGAANRITAVLSASLPYAPQPGSDVDEQLPDGAMTLTDTESEQLVPLMAGYPKQVPYGAESGEHAIDLQPDDDLLPCHTYRVDVTAALVDLNEQPVAPYSWTFTTDGCDGDVDRPDVSAQRGAGGALVGEDVYGASGAGQGRLLRVAPGRSATFYVKVQNDGNREDRLVLHGQRTTPGYRVRYFLGRTNVTAGVVAGTLRTGPRAPGTATKLRVVVTVGARAAAGSAVTRIVTATSVNDPAAVDAVRLTVRRAAPSRTRSRAAAEVQLTPADLADAAPWLQYCRLS